MEINGLNLTVVKGNELVGQLGLKDGQQIVGRLLSTSQHEALLQLAGKTIQTRLEGTQLAVGTLALFRVSLTESGTVELKVLTQLNGAEAAAKLAEQTADPRFQSAVYAALQEYGLAVSTENIALVLKNSSVFGDKWQQSLNPRVFAFLLKQKLPLTAGTVLLTWLYQDRDLRNYLWNSLHNSSVMQRNPTLLPKVIDLPDIRTGAAQPEFPVTQNMEGAVPAAPGPKLPESLSEREALQLKTLLEQSANLELTVNPRPTDGTEVILPLLVNLSANLVEEYRIRWREKGSNAAQPEREEWLRLTIPTENLGEINLAMLVSASRIRVGIKVESGTVKEYLLQHLPDLQTVLGAQAQISVLLNDSANKTDSRFDLWM
ncbi:MAG TPA: hypothetical protein VEC37_19450 [Bacillota bacterium]|nr:hypothetical protein [Bacillota bacterium]